MSDTNGLTQQTINRVSLFIAAQAREFGDELAEIGDFIRELNDCCLERELYFSLKKNGEASALNDCSLVFFLLGAGTDGDGADSGTDGTGGGADTVGRFSCVSRDTREPSPRVRELYQIARNSYSKTGKPRIVVYIKARPDQTQDEAELLREQLGADLETFHSSYTHIDTVKLGILMQIKQLDIKGLDIRLEGGKALQGNDVLMSLESVESLAGYENLQNLKQKQAELEDRFYAAMARHKEDPDDEAAYEEYRAASSERNTALQQIRGIEKQLYHMLEGMYEQTTQGKLSRRQAESYKLVERGLLSEARDVLDFNSIVSESRHDEEIAEQAAKRAEVHIKELMQLKDINAALFDWNAVEECFKEAVRLEETHNLARTVTYYYSGFLNSQHRVREGIEVGEKLALYYENEGSTNSNINFMKVYVSLGQLYMDAQQMAKAERVLLVAAEFLNNNPFKDTLESVYFSCDVYSSLGNLYCYTGRLQESIDLQIKTLGIFKELHRNSHLSNRILYILGSTYLNLSDIYVDAFMFEESVELLTEAVAFIEDMVRGNHENIDFKFLLLICRVLFGCAFTGLKRFDEAEAQFISAQDLAVFLAEANPAAYESRLAECYRAYGQMLLEAKRYSEAEEKLKLCLKINKRLADGRPDHYRYWALAYRHLGDLYKETKRLVEAEEVLSAAFRLYDKFRDSNPIFAENAAEVQKQLDDLRKSQLPEAAATRFTPEEQEVALLLTEGLTKREIVRKLGITTVEYSRRVSAIREKVSGKAEADPVIEAVADEFGLTRREADVLVYLRRGAGNDIITSELYLSEETVRAHVRNVLKKLSIEKRQDVAKWLENYANAN